MLTLSISFYRSDSAEPASIINYQSQGGNALSDLESWSTREERMCSDEEPLLVAACLHDQDTTQQHMTTLTSRSDYSLQTEYLTVLNHVFLPAL